MGGRLGLMHGFVNSRHHSFDLVQHLIVPETEDAIPTGFQEFSSNTICMMPIEMLTSVHFDDNSLLMAGEIHKIGTDRRLTAEMRPLARKLPKMPPEFPLGVGHGTAKLTRSSNSPIEFALPGFVRHRRCSPHPSAREARGGRGGVIRELGAKNSAPASRSAGQPAIRIRTWFPVGPAAQLVRRSISAPQRPSFSSSRSKPRSR